MNKLISDTTAKVTTSFLEYYQMILSKVSFDITLLKKEYQKAIEVLQPSEVDQLNNWLKKSNLENSLVRVKS